MSKEQPVIYMSVGGPDIPGMVYRNSPAYGDMQA
jgi:hypothetical protein